MALLLAHPVHVVLCLLLLLLLYCRFTLAASVITAVVAAAVDSFTSLLTQIPKLFFFQFFVVFVLMAQFVLVNVVVAVLMKHLEESHKQVRRGLRMAILERFFSLCIIVFDLPPIPHSGFWCTC